MSDHQMNMTKTLNTDTLTDQMEGLKAFSQTETHGSVVI